MEDNTWITIHRKITKWGWYSDPIVSRVFIHLLLTANHATRTWKGQQIERGQVVVGRKQLAIDLGISEQQVRTAINKLKSTSELTSRSTNKYSIVTLVNYDNYQSSNQQNNQQANQPSTNNQPQTTIKQLNKNTLCAKDFQLFWFEYPKKKDKARAEKKFLTLKKDCLPSLMSALRLQKTSEDWTKANGQYVPMPSTWLNGKRWEDEVDGVETPSDWEALSDTQRLNKARKNPDLMPLLKQTNPAEYSAIINL